MMPWPSGEKIRKKKGGLGIREAIYIRMLLLL
jgi:hypothetical protein